MECAYSGIPTWIESVGKHEMRARKEVTSAVASPVRYTTRQDLNAEFLTHVARKSPLPRSQSQVCFSGLVSDLVSGSVSVSGLVSDSGSLSSLCLRLSISVILASQAQAQF